MDQASLTQFLTILAIAFGFAVLAPVAVYIAQRSEESEQPGT
jgi:hypothetical protein